MKNQSPSVGRRKRRRKIWACKECRRRKIQCDRDQPVCGGCRKAGQPASCQYVDPPDTGNAVASHGEVSNDSLVPDSIRYSEAIPLLFPQGDPVADTQHSYAALERRLSLLEARTRSAIPAPKDFIPPIEETDTASLHDERILHGNSTYTVLHGRTFRTKFHGRTFLGTLAQCIPGLSDFTTDAFAAFPVLEEVRQAVSGAQQAVFSGSIASSQTTRAGLIKLLENRERIDSDVEQYLTQYDHVYHVLHCPTFEHDYAQMWLDIQAADVRQIILVLLIVAIVRYASPPDSGDMGLWQQATMTIDLCENVLQSSVQKYDTALDFQINFLLLLGRQLSDKWYKRTWVNAGNTLRIWMCAGLHRNVNALHSKPTALTKELRARLWAAAAEFELQAAFEHGMSGHAWLEQSDIEPPLNIADVALEQDASPKESPDYTATTFLATMSKSLRLRHQLNSVLNGASTVLSLHQHNTFTDKLYQLADALDVTKEPQSQVINALISINILQYVLALHIRQLQHSTSAIEQRGSRVTVVETAWRMLRHHKTAIELGSKLVEVMYGDHVRIALSICYCYLTTDPRSDCIVTTAIGTRSFEVMQALASLMEDKVKYAQGSRHHFWLTIAALGLMRAKKNPVQRDVYVEEAVELFVEPYKRMLQEQQENARGQQDSGQSIDPSTLIHTAFDAPTQLDLSIDEWFYQWCDNPTTWP
jgi:hypothetical protein